MAVDFTQEVGENYSIQASSEHTVQPMEESKPGVLISNTKVWRDGEGDGD